MNIGYASILFNKESIQSQIRRLESAGCEEIYLDHINDMSANRPELIKMLENIQSGDNIIVCKTYYVFRSLQQMRDLIFKFNELGVSFESLDQPLHNTASNPEAILKALDILIEFKRCCYNENQEYKKKVKKELLQVIPSKKIKLSSTININRKSIDKYNYVIYLYDFYKIPLEEACKKAELSKTTFYKIQKSMLDT